VLPVQDLRPERCQRHLRLPAQQGEHP
jgi:hypothetical protein